jgi:hypothetical protein
VNDKAEATADKLVMTILELEHAAASLPEAAARRAISAAKEARRFMAKNYEWAFYLERS